MGNVKEKAKQERQKDRGDIEDEKAKLMEKPK